MAAKPKKIVIVLEERNDKKHSVRYETGDDAPITNIYLRNDGVEALGDPDKLKITIEPA